MIERTLVFIKPDGVQRAIVGRVMQRFEDVGLKIVGMKMVKLTESFAKKHYPESLIPIIGEKTLTDWEEIGIKTDRKKEEIGREAWNDLIKFSTEAPVVAMVLEGVHAVSIVRKMVGPTSPHRAPPGTIRGDFSHLSMGYATLKHVGGRNIIHASGSVKEAENEIALWFRKEELFDYKTTDEKQVR